VNRFAQTTLWYTLAGLVGPIVALALTPLYTRTIGVAGYGTVDVLLTLWQGVFTVTLWGMATVLAGLYSGSQSEDQRQRVVLSIGIAVVLLALLIGGGVYGFSSWIAKLTHRAEASAALPYFVGALPFAVIYTTLLQVFRLRNDIRRTVLSILALVVVTAATRVGMVVVAGWGVLGMIQAAAMTNVLMALFTVAIGWQIIGTRIDGAVIKTFYRSGLPMLPVSLAGWALLYADRWLLVPHVSPIALGQYALAVLLASLLAFVIEPLKNAWQPVALQLRRCDADAFLALSYRLYESLALLFVGGLVLSAPALLWVIGADDALAAAPYVLPLASMPILGGVQLMLGIRAVRDGRTTVFGWSAVSAAVVNIGLNLVFIPQYGVSAAAWATAAAVLSATIVLGMRERATARALRIAGGLWLVALWGLCLEWWVVYGPGWTNGVALLLLGTVTVVRAWPALIQWRQLSSGIEPQADYTGMPSEVVVQREPSVWE
jgi:O-antigen/teichoic acid export membrane protein